MTEQIKDWICIVCDCRDMVADYAERYPSEGNKLLQKYDSMIDQMYNSTKTKGAK